MAATEFPVLQSAVGHMDGGENLSNTAYNVSFENNTEAAGGGHATNPKVFVLLASMFAAGVFGNILAIIVLARSSRDHKQTVFYRLVGALACTDLFGTCAISPISLLVYSRKITLIEGTALCNYNGFMFIFAGCATIFIIGAMAIDRYLAIRCPFFYDKHMRVSRAKYVVISLWGFAAFMGCLPIVGLGDIVVQFPRSWCFFTFTSASVVNKIYAYSYVAIGLFVISLTAMSNVFVTMTLLKMRRKSRRTFNTVGTKRTDSELQMMVLLLGVVVVFSVCWCPFLIRIIINQVHEEQRDILADLNALKLASLNQILDPWVYILFRKELFIRWYSFLKTKVFSKCIGACKEERDQVAVLVDRNRNNGDICRSFTKQNGTMDNELTDLNKKENGHSDDLTRHGYDRKTTEKYSERYSNHSTPSHPRNNSESETVPLNEVNCSGCHGIHMRHSACLFCFASQSKNFAISSLGDSKSMDNIHSCSWQCNDLDLDEKGHGQAIRMKETKRNLSFTDLRLQHARKCESKEPRVSLEY